MFLPRIATTLTLRDFPGTDDENARFYATPVIERYRRLWRECEYNLNSIEALVSKLAKKPKSQSFIYLVNSPLPLNHVGRNNDFYEKFPDLREFLTNRLDVIGKVIRENRFRLVFRVISTWNNYEGTAQAHAELKSLYWFTQMLGYTEDRWHPNGLSLLVSPGLGANTERLLAEWSLLPEGLRKLICVENNLYKHIFDLGFIGSGPRRIPSVFNISNHIQKTGGLFSPNSPLLPSIKENWHGRRPIIIQPSNDKVMVKHTNQLAEVLEADIIPQYMGAKS